MREREREREREENVWLVGGWCWVLDDDVFVLAKMGIVIQ